MKDSGAEKSLTVALTLLLRHWGRQPRLHSIVLTAHVAIVARGTARPPIPKIRTTQVQKIDRKFAFFVNLARKLKTSLNTLRIPLRCTVTSSRVNTTISWESLQTRPLGKSRLPFIKYVVGNGVAEFQFFLTNNSRKLCSGIQVCFTNFDTRNSCVSWL